MIRSLLCFTIGMGFADDREPVGDKVKANKQEPNILYIFTDDQSLRSHRIIVCISKELGVVNRLLDGVM